MIDVQPPHIDDWLAWASVNGVLPVVQAYLKMNPRRLHEYDATRFVNPTPRQWEQVSDLLKQDIPAGIRMPLTAGLVGPVASELEAIMKLTSDVPTYEDIITNPETAAIPDTDKLAAAYFVVMMLAQRITVTDSESAAIYVSRLQKDMQVMFVSLVSSNKPDINQYLWMRSPAYKEAAKHVVRARGI